MSSTTAPLHSSISNFFPKTKEGAMKLTEVPIELRTEILCKLFITPLIPSDAPDVCTVESSSWSLNSFPDDMLHAAQASTKLSEAVIRAIGSHAKILNFHRSRRLSEWIPILRKHIRSVSLSGLPPLGIISSGDDFQQEDMLKTLKALYSNGVALESLNLEDLIVSDPGRAAEMLEHVIKAIQTNSLSLKEIALHINFASAMALSYVTLPNLQVAQISSDDVDGEGVFEMFNILSPPIMFGSILQGINGHADRSLGITTLRELRLYHMHRAPLLPRGSCLSLFSAIEKLIIMSGDESKNNEIARFVANFRNLKTFHWFTGYICPEDMDTIFGGCPNLQKLNIFAGQRRILSGEVDLPQNTSRLKDLFVSFRGKHRRLELGTYLSAEQIENLGENSPNLRILEMEIDSHNVEGLYSLLGVHCRKLRELRLLYSRDAIDCLDREGWNGLAQAVCSASDEFCVVSLVGDTTGPMIERASREMVEAIVKILQFMGDRAIRIVFRVPINTHNPFIVLDAVFRTLSEAKINCRFIETLCLDFIQHASLGEYRIELADEDRLMKFFACVTELQSSFFQCKSQKIVDLGDIDVLWETIDGMEGEGINYGQDIDEASDDEMLDAIVPDVD